MTKQFAILCLSAFVACADRSGTGQRLAHYDLDKPEKLLLPAVLREVSGIAFNGDNDDTIYAEQDEEGRLFHFKWGDKDIFSSKFAKKGDYEDVAIIKGIVIMLRSDGLLISFPLNSAQADKVPDAREWSGLLPGGEFEGMYADQSSGKLYVLCKHCPGDKSEGLAAGFVFSVSADGAIVADGNFSLDVRSIGLMAAQKKLRFRPSGLARNSGSGDWYILSSVNNMMVITDGNWKVKQVVPLPSSVFNQPEGIAFDKKHNLYISNEGVEGRPGNILKFIYRE